MKNIQFLILNCLLFGACSNEKESDSNVLSNETIAQINIRDTTVDLNTLSYDNQTSTWSLNGILYSGYAITKFENGSINQKFGVFNGKKQYHDSTWFQSGNVKSIANYHNGRLHGVKKIWSEDSTYNLVAEYNYHLGKGHGEQIKWYSTGELFQISNLNMGKEEGIQQAYRKNGVLYANYEAKNGRIFGQKRASLCFELEDQEIKNDD